MSSTELAARWGSRLHEQLVLALPTCSPQITANIMYSFGKLAMQPAPELLQVGREQHGPCRALDNRSSVSMRPPPPGNNGPPWPHMHCLRLSTT